MATIGEIVRERAERDIAAVETILRRGGGRLRGRMRRSESHLERVTADVGAPLASYATATVLAGGKRLRPLLVMLAAEGAPEDGEVGAVARSAASEDALIRAAAAVELMHSATLVHDDVIDGARLRRGHPTVAALYGRGAATATGDLLFSRAFAELARNGDPDQLRALSDASSALAAGELLQREDAFMAQVSVERYMERCELKTAALFEAACRLGVLASSPEVPAAAPARPARAALADRLGAFARRIGLAFQLLDDVLDVSGPVADTGKPRGTDLLEGTVTLPLILARQCDTELAELDLSALGAPGRVETVCDRIAATGALAEARAWALDVVRDAKASLPDSLPARLAALLNLVADAVVDRYR